ncbi:DUF5615 family PIN-like protein [Rhodocaloribacter sp.]
MLRLAADENFNSNIVRGLLRRRPDLNILRVQDVGLAGADDPAILSWAAGEGRTPGGAGKGVVFGAGIGMIFGAAFGKPGVGMVIGAGIGLVLGGAWGRSGEG